MLKKSVETRDWLHSLEPRTVRAVMKRVVEEITSVDSQVKFLICRRINNIVNNIFKLKSIYVLVIYFFLHFNLIKKNNFDFKNAQLI